MKYPPNKLQPLELLNSKPSQSEDLARRASVPVKMPSWTRICDYESIQLHNTFGTERNGSHPLPKHTSFEDRNGGGEQQFILIADKRRPHLFVPTFVICAATPSSAIWKVRGNLTFSGSPKQLPPSSVDLLPPLWSHDSAKKPHRTRPRCPSAKSFRNTTLPTLIRRRSRGSAAQRPVVLKSKRSG